MSLPSSTTVPLSGSKWPVIRLNSVDLPAPFGPITAAICCVSTVNDTSETATKPENDLRNALISSIAPAMGQPGPAGVEGAHDAARKGKEQHHQDCPQHQGPVLGVGGDLLVEDGQHRGADHRPPEMIHPAQDGHDHHIGGFRPEHKIGVDAAVEDAKECSRESAKNPGDGE